MDGCKPASEKATESKPFGGPSRILGLVGCFRHLLFFYFGSRNTPLYASWMIFGRFSLTGDMRGNMAGSSYSTCCYL